MQFLTVCRSGYQIGRNAMSRGAEGRLAKRRRGAAPC